VPVQGGLENVTSMFLYLAKEYLAPGASGAPEARAGSAEAVASSLRKIEVQAARETPPLGLYHPDHGMTHQQPHLPQVLPLQQILL